MRLQNIDCSHQLFSTKAEILIVMAGLLAQGSTYCLPVSGTIGTVAL